MLSSCFGSEPLQEIKELPITQGSIRIGKITGYPVSLQYITMTGFFDSLGLRTFRASINAINASIKTEESAKSNPIQ